MKNLKSIFLIAFMVMTVSAAAQLKMGGKIGFNASTISNYNKFFDVDKLVAKYRPGFSLGLIAQYMFGSKLGIESGLNYTTLGANSEYTNKSDKVEANLNFSYIQLPVSFLYKFNVGPDLSLYPSVGAYLGYAMVMKFKVSSGGPIANEVDLLKVEDKDIDIDILPNRLDAGLTFGLNLQYDKCVFGLGYDLGLMNPIKFSEENEAFGLKTNNSNIRASLGYFF